MRLSKFPMAALHVALILPVLTACGGGGSTSSSNSNTTTTTAVTSTSTGTTVSTAPKAATVLPSSDRLLYWMGKNPFPNINRAIFDAQTGTQVRLELANKGMPPQDYQELLSGTFDPATGRANNVSAIAWAELGKDPWVFSLTKSAPQARRLTGIASYNYCGSAIIQDWAQPWQSIHLSISATDCTTGAGTSLLLQTVDGAGVTTRTNGEYSPVSFVYSASGALSGFVAIKNGSLYKTDRQLATPQLIANSTHSAASMVSPWLGVDKQLFIVDGTLRMLDLATLTLGPSLGALNSADLVATEADGQNVYLFTSAPVSQTAGGYTYTNNTVKASKISRSAPYARTELTSMPGYPVSIGMTKNRLAVMVKPDPKNVCSTCSSTEISLYSILKERLPQAMPYTWRTAGTSKNFTAIYSHPEATQFVVTTGAATMPLFGSGGSITANAQRLTDFLFSGTGGLSTNTVEHVDEALKTLKITPSTVVAGKLLKQTGYASTAISHLVTISFLSTGPASNVSSLNLLSFQNTRMDSSSAGGLAASVADLSKGSYSFSGLDYGTAMIFGVTGSDGSLVNTRYVEVETEGSLR